MSLPLDPDPGPSTTRSMTVVNGIHALEPSLGRLFVVIGVFDGLHRGHDYLLGELRREATQRDARPAVITFDHHPDEILTGKAPPLLCDPTERLQRLEAAGVVVTVVQTFDVALRETPYDAFIGRIADRVELKGFLMTPDSAFGYQRAGTPDTVAALGRERGFDVAVVPPFELDGRPVSSSAIRAAIQAGDLATAERLLGRRYAVIGRPHTTDDCRAVTLSFDMPVTLPPAGRYRVRVESEDAEGRVRVESEDAEGRRRTEDAEGRGRTQGHELREATIEPGGGVSLPDLAGDGRRWRFTFDEPPSR